MTPRDARATSAVKISAIGLKATSFAEAALPPHKVRAAALPPHHKVRAAEAAVVDLLACMRAMRRRRRARRRMGRKRRKVRRVSHLRVVFD